MSNVNEKPNTKKRSSKKVVEEVEKETTVAVIGVVANCEKLRIRSTSNVIDDNVVTEIVKGTEVQIDMENSTEEFYNVYVASGAAGFCMKQFIEIK